MNHTGFLKELYLSLIFQYKKILETLFYNYLYSPRKQKKIAVLVSLFFSNLGDKSLRRRITNLITHYVRELEKIVHQGQATQRIRKDLYPGTGALLFFGLIQWLVFLNYLTGLSKEMGEDKDLAWNIYLKGIQTCQE